jgi:hypothetical protein
VSDRTDERGDGMKNHLEAEAALKSHDLHLVENINSVWTGGLTTQVTYCAKDNNGNNIAKSSFDWNRHPGCYRRQGFAAKVGTSRYLALSDISDQLACLAPDA